MSNYQFLSAKLLFPVKRKRVIYRRKKIGEEKMSVTQKINQETLKEKGRLKFFYHCPDSKLPIRNVLEGKKNGEKTEPHIEIGTENYLNCCYQDYLKTAIEDKEKYIFWMTTCENFTLPEFNERLIVGYLILQQSKKVAQDRFFFKGKPFIFDFKDALPVKDLGYTAKPRMQTVNELNTKKILAHFEGKENIINECIEEIKIKDPKNITCYRVTSNFECNYKDECLRWKEK